MKTEFDRYPQNKLIKWDKYGRYALYYDVKEKVVPANELDQEHTIYTAQQVIADSNSRESLIEAIIRSRYTTSDELALHRKVVAQEAGAQVEFDAYNAFVNEAKTIVDSILNE
jgi:hypothetical protein